MVATNTKTSERPKSWLDQGAPNTPTTPVAKQPSKKKRSKNSRRSKKKGPSSATAAPTATRPDFCPPIVTAMVPQRTPSVRFDLSGSHNSAFTAVEPRKSTGPGGVLAGHHQHHTATPTQNVPLTMEPALTAHIITTDIQSQRQTLTSSSTLYAPNEHLSSPAPNSSSPRTNDPYSGPVDVDGVSATSSASSDHGNREKQETFPGAENKQNDAQEQEEEEEQRRAKPDCTREMQHAASATRVPTSPSSQATPPTTNTRTNWLVSQKEPFQQPGMLPHSPPVSTRHLLASGMTLPEVHLSSQEQLEPQPHSKVLSFQRQQRQQEQSSSLPGTTSPPLSPLRLEESLLALQVRHRDSSKSPAVTSNVHLRLADPSSTPPLSPFDDHPPEAPASPPLESSALALPFTTASKTTPEPMAAAEERRGNTKSTEGTDRDLPHVGYKSDQGEDDFPSPATVADGASPTPPSPPTLPRTSGMDPNNNWLQVDMEPFLLEQMMQEEPMSPPLSGRNLDPELTSMRKGPRTVSPPTSPPAALEMTQKLLLELRPNQTKLDAARQKKRDAKKAASIRKKKEVYAQLHRAQQVVRVILKGSSAEPFEDEDQDVTSPQACYEAIRQYAELKVQSSKLRTQLEDSKQQLKARYLEWKQLRKDMVQQQQQMKKPLAEEEEPVSSATQIDNQDSLALLQQLMSDDESIYKEDDATNTAVEKGGGDMGHLPLFELSSNESFSVSINVDQEKDTSKAMEKLFQEMQGELKTIQAAWEHRDSQTQKQSDSLERRDEPELHHSAMANLESRKLDEDPSMQAFDHHPLEGSDSFLLSKIEELTAQIETMEQDRTALSGYMDQLAKDVIQADDTEEMLQTPVNEGGASLPESWTTFGSNFPIYRVNESEDEETSERESSDDQEETSGTGDEIDDAAGTFPSNTAAGPYRPQSLLFRSRRFRACKDGDTDMGLPYSLPQSRGVSYERSELKQTFSDLDEEDMSSELEAKLAQLALFQESTTEDDESFGSLEKKVSSSLSFESFFLRGRFSEPTSLARRKLHATFLSKYKSKHVAIGEEGTSLLQPHDAVLGISDNGEHCQAPNLVVDPFSSPSSPPPASGAKRPAALDSQLIQKLQSPEIELELSLPRKITAVPAQESDEASTLRPSSPLGGNKKETREGYVRLSSKLLQAQQDLHNSRAQLKLLQKKQKLSILELTKAEREIEKWKQMATTFSLEHNAKSAEGGPAEQQRLLETLKEQTKELIDMCQKEKEKSETDEQDESFGQQLQHVLEQEQRDLEAKASEQAGMAEQVKHLQTQLAQSQEALTTLEGQYNMTPSKLLEMEKSSPRTVGSGGGAVEVKLLEKAEECDRLTAQVTSLTEQLETQMANVSELERMVAANVEESKGLKKKERLSVLVGQMLTDREECQAQAWQSDELKTKTGVDELDVSNISHAATSTFPILGPNPQTNNGNELDESSRSIDRATRAPASNNPISAPERHSGTTAKGRGSGLLRNLLNQSKRFSLASSKQDRNMQGYSTPTTEAQAEGGANSVARNPFETTALLDAAVCGGDTAVAPSGGEELGSDSFDGSNHTSTAASYVNFQRKTSIGLDASEDAQLATIHVLMKRIEELEEENLRLKSTLGEGLEAQDE